MNPQFRGVYIPTGREEGWRDLNTLDLTFGIVTLILATYAFAHTERARGRFATVILAFLGVLEIASAIYV